ncbi:hypothetical protein Psfp_00890 [Pelotomaculum sp. FP]|nr:hypothetical protein Psfp_00890 [Pelotomaculum sp. FP]
MTAKFLTAFNKVNLINSRGNFYGFSSLESVA